MDGHEKRTGRPQRSILDGAAGERLRIVEAALEYLRSEPSASDKELRAHLRATVRPGHLLTQYDLVRLRREAGVSATPLRQDDDAARACLTAFYTANVKANKASAIAHLRREGLAPPPSLVFIDARRAGRKANTPPPVIEREDAVEIMTDHAYEYLAREPGAGNTEIRSYVYAQTKLRTYLTEDEITTLRADVGAVPTPTRADPYEAFASLCGFYRRQPGAKPYEARAFLRHKGLRSPGRDLISRARSQGRAIHEMLETPAAPSAEAESPCE